MGMYGIKHMKKQLLESETVQRKWPHEFSVICF